MKLLIYGSKGWIGSQILEYLNAHNIEYVKGSVRVENTKEVEEEIRSINPTNVLCLVGRTHGQIGDKVYTTIDYLEQKGKLVENIRDNLFAQVSLSLICSKLGVHLSTIATGCIYSYDDTHDQVNGFTEDDLPNFFESSYSIVKGFNDRLMHMLPVFSARIRMPISSQPNSRNFITKITKYEKICSMANSMTVLDDFIPILIDLCEKKYIGTLNFTNPGVISHNEILEMYREIVDPNFTWKNFSYEEQIQILAAGRSNNLLDTTLLSSLYPELPSIQDSVRSALTKYKTHL
jgi:3,5-epimerase/4-reductase